MGSDQVSSKNRDGLSGNVSSVRSHNANRLYDIFVDGRIRYLTPKRMLSLGLASSK
jgi:hypothetical protein